MKNLVEEIADLLMYKGPSMKEIIKKALEEGEDFRVEENGELSTLSVSLHLPYGIQAYDKYFYNSENQLVKQIISIKNKEKVIFDKYAQAAEILLEMDNRGIKAS